MSNFEKITASPGALGKFLAALPVATGPWDESFRKAFCNSCKRKNCDGKKCPHQDKRNNPTWWLTMGGKPGEVPGLTIKIKAAFPIEWGREYYTVEARKKQLHAPCACCDNTGEVTIKGVQYKCPRCNGNWREKEVVAETTKDGHAGGLLFLGCVSGLVRLGGCCLLGGLGLRGDSFRCRLFLLRGGSAAARFGLYRDRASVRPGCVSYNFRFFIGHSHYLLLI